MRKAQEWSLAQGDYPRLTRANGLFQKKSKQVNKLNPMENMCPQHLLSPFKEKTCGYSWGQLKKKWNFHGCSRKTHVEFPWVLVFDLRISTKGVSHNFSEFIGVNACFIRVKWQIWKFRFSEKYIYPQPFLEFLWNSPILMKVWGRECLACNVPHQANKIGLT